MYFILGVRDFKTDSPYSLSSGKIGPAIVALKLLRFIQSIISKTSLTGEIRPRKRAEFFPRTTFGSCLKNSVSTPMGIISVFLKRAVKAWGEVQKTLFESKTERSVRIFPLA